jgi:hypothetical protein
MLNKFSRRVKKFNRKYSLAKKELFCGLFWDLFYEFENNLL